MAIPTTRKTEQSLVNETQFSNHTSTPQHLPLYGFEENDTYQQVQYNNSVANFNRQMSENVGHNYYNQQSDMFQGKQYYGASFGEFGTEYGFSQPTQGDNFLLPSTNYNYNSMQTGGFPKQSIRISNDWGQEALQEPSPKRQKIQGFTNSKVSKNEFLLGAGRLTNLNADCDGESVSSECCSSCSSGDPCDEPDCEELKVVAVPCDEQSCDESACPCPDPCLVTAPDGCVIPTSHVIRPSSRIDNWKKIKSPWTAAAPRSIQGNIHVPLDPYLQRAVDTLSIASSSKSSKQQNPLVAKQPVFVDNTSSHAPIEPLAQRGDPNASTIVSGIGTHFESSASNTWSGAYSPKLENIDPVFNCGWSGCAEPFHSEADLGFHVHQKHVDPQLIFRCPAPTCNEKMSPEPLQSHIQLNHGFNFDTDSTCLAPDCAPVIFYNPIDIHSHFHRAHTDPNTQPLLCGWDSCGDEFKDQDQLWSHLPNHYQLDIPQLVEADFNTYIPKYPPTIVDEEIPVRHGCRWKANDIPCGKTFEDEEKLQQHVFDNHIKQLKKTKLGYFCEWEGCSRKAKKDPAKVGFDQRSKIERHTFTHTGHKPSKCDICGAKFSADQARDQHVRSAHTNERPFKCTFCDKSFPQHSACLMHMRTHTGEKPLSCDLCGQKFGESSNLAKHRKIHGAQGSHVCNFPGCGKTFVRATQLKKHLDEHGSSSAESVSGKTSTSGTDTGDGDS